jgi:hypothetical protein
MTVIMRTMSVSVGSIMIELGSVLDRAVITSYKLGHRNDYEIVLLHGRSMSQGMLLRWHGEAVVTEEFLS